MQLSEWQLGRLRNALRQFHSLKSSSDGSRYNWNDVVEAIDEYVGVRVPYESIRKFVNGVRQDNGSYRHQTPTGERLQAIYDFATHPLINLLTEAEITEREVSFNAALRLLDFLEQDFDGERILPPSDIEGRYYHTRISGGSVCSRLDISAPLESGVVKVSQVERYFDIDKAPFTTAKDAIESVDCHKSEVRHFGWGIMTPEDNFFIFLKEERVGRNRYYFTLASDFDRASDTKLKSLSLLHHDYPFETRRDHGAQSADESRIDVCLSGNLQSFERDEGASQ